MYSEKKYFSIGEVAKLKNITAKALRYYHDIELFVPEYVDESNGYRYYTLEQLLNIDIIKLVRNAGGSIKELQNLYAHEDMEYLAQFLKDKNNEVQEKIKQLEETKIMIENITNKIEDSLVVAKTVGFHTKYFSERYLITSPLTKIVDLEHIFDYHQLEDKMNNHEIRTKYQQGILYNLSVNGELEPTSVFEVIDKENAISNELDSSFIKLPEGYFLTCTISKEMKDLELKRVLNYLNKKKINPKFILLFEVFNNFFNFDNYYFQIQVYIGDTPLNL